VATCRFMMTQYCVDVSIRTAGPVHLHSRSVYYMHGRLGPVYRHAAHWLHTPRTVDTITLVEMFNCNWYSALRISRRGLVLGYYNIGLGLGLDLRFWLCLGLMLGLVLFSVRTDGNLQLNLAIFRPWTENSKIRARVFCGMWIAECRKLSRGNLRKIKCRTFRKFPRCRFSTFRSRKIPHFHWSQNYRSLALHNRCATDAYQRQASRGPLKNEKMKNGLSDIAAQCWIVHQTKH